MPVEVDRAVKHPYPTVPYNYRTISAWMSSHDGGCCRKCTTCGLTTAMGSALVGDATLAIRGFRILGRHPLSIHHLALLLHRNDCRTGGVKYVT